MTKPDNIIKLLLVDDSVDDAEQTISILRNGGIAVRPARASTDVELEAAFEQQMPDLILVDIGSKNLSIKQVHDLAERGGRDIALIGSGRSLTEDAIVKAFRDGARAMMLRDSHEHVQMIVRREFEALTMRRGVRRLEASLRSCTRACTCARTRPTSRCSAWTISRTSKACPSST